MTTEEFQATKTRLDSLRTELIRNEATKEQLLNTAKGLMKVTKTPDVDTIKEYLTQLRTLIQTRTQELDVMRSAVKEDIDQFEELYRGKRG